MQLATWVIGELIVTLARAISVAGSAVPLLLIFDTLDRGFAAVLRRRIAKRMIKTTRITAINAPTMAPTTAGTAADAVNVLG